MIGTPLPTHLPNIALIGHAGAGKTTCAEILNEIADYRTYSFAEPLKDVAAQLWGSEARKDRGKLQGLGVAVREIEADTWADLLLARTAGVQGRVVVDDCRFPNEYHRLREAGFRILKVHANHNTRLSRLRTNGKLQHESQLEHVSETSLDGYSAEAVIFNISDRDALAYQLAEFLNRVRS